jgi:hypothetical protein
MTRPERMLFLTGSLRSGTSLATQLLAAAAGGQACSQPMPLIMVRLMAEFLESQGASDLRVRYPLADEVFGSAIDHAAWSRFLGNRMISPDEAKQWLVEDAEYSGVKHTPLDGLARLGAWSGGPLDDLARVFLAPGGGLGGPVIWKETNCEVFTPYLLGAAVRVVVIVRDPRDTLTSQLHGRADQNIGAPRPMLFLLRHWRKSVAWALSTQQSPSGAIARFEALVRDPGAELDRVLGDIGLSGGQSWREGLAGWESNTSFAPMDGVSRQAIGRHETVLDDQTRDFIEAACLPEMAALGFPIRMTAAEARDHIAAGPGDEVLNRPELAAYAWSQARRDEEWARFDSLLEASGAFDPKVHINTIAHATLVSALNPFRL